MIASKKLLHHFIEHIIQENGQSIYIKTASNSYCYQQVFDLAKKYQKIFESNGIQKQDRIVIYASKNMSSIAVMIASSLCGAIYVPISSINPASRAIQIIDEATPRFIVCDKECGTALQSSGREINILCSNDEMDLCLLKPSAELLVFDEEIAFILFTSGSTGTPKGVVISHEAAIVFIEWAAYEFGITSSDVISSIAPFNFDLSVFDIYVTAMSGATLLLYSENETKNALLMAMRLSEDKASTIYATPTFYAALANYGKLHKYDYACLKNVLFAGEVFHLENFAKLLQYWPHRNYANLYGPTETNVCTFFKVDVAHMNYLNFPIGLACPYASLLLLSADDKVVESIDMEGELIVAGTSVFNQYWKDEDKTSAAFYSDAKHQRYYRTGDIVYRNKEGAYVYVARKDRMIKKNGYRIEPSEIEKIVVSYPKVSNAVVLFSKEKNILICFVESVKVIDNDIFNIRVFCQNHLPLYMLPDKFVVLFSMPQTSSGKVDLQALKNMI